MVPEDLESALDEIGIERGRSSAREVWALCPNPDHEDSRPTNYSISRETGAGYCFSCGYRHASFATLAAPILRLDGWAMSKWIRARGGTLTARLARTEGEPEVSRQKTPTGFSLASQIAVYSTEIPEDALVARRITADAAREYGVRWDAEQEAFVLPIFSPSGDLLGWQTRAKPRPKNHPRGIEKSSTLFGIEIFRGPRMVLVESPLDAVRFWSAGIDGAVASFGARVSRAQLRLIFSRAERLLLALDDDEAGHRMTDEICEKYGKRLPIHVFSYEGWGKDPGELDDDELLAGIRHAEFALARTTRAGVHSR
jgi:hypothetical protein